MVRDSDFLFVSPQTWISAAVMLLMLPLSWVSAWFFAALIHELSHVLAVYLCGARIVGIQVGTRGAKIETDALTDVQTIFCALAGPAGGLVLLLLARQFPRLAVCGFFQSLFNLLPFYPLDGGRALRGFAALFCSRFKKIKIPCK